MYPPIAFWPTRRSDLNIQPVRTRQAGISLLEVAMLMVIVTCAMVPIIHNIGGPTNTQGNAARAVGLQSKEILLANTLIEQALASDYQTFNCNSSFNTANFPTAGKSSNFPSSNRCVNNSYSQPLYYRWTVHNTAQAGILPTGNEYYTAVLNVFDKQTGGNPILTMPTSFFRNTSGGQTVSSKIGIMIVQDISGSMASSKPSGSVGNVNQGDVASPFLRYRYHDPAYPAYNNYPGGSPLNLYDNKQLDIAAASPDDPTTPQNESYLAPNILGAPKCTSKSNINSAHWLPSNFYANGTYSKALDAVQQDAVINICKRSSNYLDTYMSRIEAARSSLLSFLVSMEQDPSLYENTQLGLMTFSSNGGTGNQLLVNMESPTGAPAQYKQMRRKISWINRDGPGLIPSGGGTMMYEAVRDGANNLFTAPNLDSRIILLVTDGEPHGPFPNGDPGQYTPANHAAFQDLASQIGNGTFPGSNKQSATIYTLGLIYDYNAMQPWLETDLASRTPGGQFFYANTVKSMPGIFDQIKYQIQRVILLNKSNRFNVDFN
jgi:hypothetical protein